MQQKPRKILTQAERDAITAKYHRRIIERGIALFGMPPEDELDPSLGPFTDPYAEERAIAKEQGRAKSEESRRRIYEATLELLAATPPPADEETPAHRKPGDLNRTAERIRSGEVDLPDPALDREQVAASFDAHAEFERSKIAFGQKMDAVAHEAITGLLPIMEGLKDFAFDVFHEFKRWAAEDPDGPGAEMYEKLNRALRQGTGRSRARG
jgi:hypothetical protein